MGDKLSSDSGAEATARPLSGSSPGQLPPQFGRYRILRPLGRGSMGSVFLAEDTQLARRVALKIPSLTAEESDELLERFYREARAAATLRHPGICPVYDVGEIQGQHFLSMAFIEGKPLSAVLKSAGAQKERTSLLLIRKLAAALQVAHDAGIIHRDLKPANIMIDGRGEPVITDFGLAFLSGEERTRLTQSGVVLGSPAYMSPEQLDGPVSQLNPASDQFALGVILFELLTGQLPFQGSISAVAHQIVNSDAPSPGKLRADLSPRTIELCQKLLAKKPSARFGSMKVLADHIAQLLKSESEPAKSDPAAPPAAKPGSKAESSTEEATANYQKQVLKLIEWGELISALEILERPDSKLSGKLADWARQKRAEVRQLVDHWKEQLPPQYLLASKLATKHDYGEAARLLALIPVGVRNEEVSSLLSECQEKQEEVDQLLKDIEKVFRTGTDDELKWLVKRFLQLKPGHQQMRRLADDLKRYGPEQVIRQRRKQKNYLDPAGAIWDPKHLAAYVAGLAAACAALYAATWVFQSPRGTVAIEVFDPSISIDFRDRQISMANTGESFPQAVGEKQMLAARISGQLIPEATQELMVERNETKRVQARLVDGRLEITINSEKKVFSAQPRDLASGRAPSQLVSATSAPPAATEPWIDLLGTVDPATMNRSNFRWDLKGDSLVGTVLGESVPAWVNLDPDQELTGDYDFEMEFVLAGANYMQVSVPLNETSAILSLSNEGCSWAWIDGKGNYQLADATPFGSRTAVLKEGQKHRVTIRVRHQGPNLSLKAALDGVPAGEFDGLRSRVTVLPDAKAVPRRFRTVAKMLRFQPPNRFEVSQMRVRRVSAPLSPPDDPSAPVDLLAHLRDPGKLLVNGVATVPLPPGKGELWAFVLPEYEFGDDYDLAVDYSVQGTGFVAFDLPLNETKVAFAMTTAGSGLAWIDGRDFPFGNVQRPVGEPGVSIVPGKVRRLAFNVRHQGANVSVKATVDGQPAGSFEGLRSRLSIPNGSPEQRRMFKVVSHLNEPANAPVLKVHAARLVRKPVQSSPADPSAPPPARGEIVIDADFRKSLSGFNTSDQDWILEEYKNGEFRYLGKKPGWWFSPFNRALYRPENGRIRDFIVDFDIRMMNQNVGEFAIQFCRYGDWYYKLCYNHEGGIRVLGIGETELGPPVRSPALKPIDQFNNVRMTLENHVLSVAVNGQPLFEKKIDHYAAGGITAWTLVKDAPLDIRLQRFRLEKLSTAPATPPTTPVRRLKGHTGVIRGVAFLPDSQQAVSVAEDSTFKLWDVTSGKLLFDFPGHGAAVTCVAVSADGRRAVTGCDDTHVRFWDLEKRTLLKTLKGHTGGITTVIISKDGDTAYSGGWDNTIRKWDLRSNAKPAVLPGPDGESNLAFSPNESLIACSARDGSVALRGAKEAGLLTGHDLGPVRGLAFTPDGSRLVGGGYGSTVRVWDIQNGKQLFKFDSEDAGFDTVAVTNDGRYVLGGCSDYTIRGWDLHTGDPILRITADGPVTHRMALAPDNTHVLTGGGNWGGAKSGDYDLRLWKLPTPPAPRPAG